MLSYSMYRRKEKEKITSIKLYRRECEPVGHALITVFRDAVYGFMPPVGRWALGV
jgi:hypothetical protein